MFRGRDGGRQISSTWTTHIMHKGDQTRSMSRKTETLSNKKTIKLMLILACLATQIALTMAAQWADRVIVLDRQRLRATGAPEDVPTAAMFTEIYGMSAAVERNSRGGLQVVMDG